MTRLRPATTADAAQIAAIYEPWVRDTVISFELEPPTPDEMALRIENVATTHPWLVSEEEGVVVGYAYAKAFAERPAYRWSVETTVYLHPSHRGRGVGRDLYRALLDLAELWGFANAFAGIALPNPTSESLHEAVGFHRIGVFPRAGHKFGAWHDVGWWHRPLAVTEDPSPPLRPSPEQVEALLHAI